MHRRRRAARSFSCVFRELVEFTAIWLIGVGFNPEPEARRAHERVVFPFVLWFGPFQTHFLVSSVVVMCCEDLCAMMIC